MPCNPIANHPRSLRLATRRAVLQTRSIFERPAARTVTPIIFFRLGVSRRADDTRTPPNHPVICFITSIDVLPLSTFDIRIPSSLSKKKKRMRKKKFGAISRDLFGTKRARLSDHETGLSSDICSAKCA